MAKTKTKDRGRAWAGCWRIFDILTATTGFPLQGPLCVRFVLRCVSSGEEIAPAAVVLRNTGARGCWGADTSFDGWTNQIKVRKCDSAETAGFETASEETTVLRFKNLKGRWGVGFLSGSGRSGDGRGSHSLLGKWRVRKGWVLL